MANSELYDKQFPIPQKIINHINSAIIKNPKADGVKRAKFIVKNKHLSYQALKRIKNFFDNFNSEKDTKEKYELAGGELMRDYIERELTSNRNAIDRSKKIKQMIDPNLTNALKTQKNPRLNEGVDIENRNVIIIMVNMENKILLLKRNPESDWGANRWAFIGGSIQEGETATEACKRECKEETGIEPDEVINVFNIQRNLTDNTEYVFACRHYGNNTIKLNGEHTKYDWFSIDEIKSLSGKVPNLDDYLSVAFKNYNS